MGSKWLKRASIDANGLKLARIILSSGIRKWFFSGLHLDGNDPSREFCKIWIGLEFSVTGLGPWLRGVLEKSKIQKRRIFFLAFFHRVREDPQAYRLGEKIITSMHKIVKFIEAFYTRNFVIFSTCRSRYIRLSQLQTLVLFITTNTRDSFIKVLILVTLYGFSACPQIRTQILRA